jgi:PBSX family phage portal protein
MRAVHDESPEETRVVLPDVDLDNSQLFDRSSDPFAKSVEKIKTYGGLSATTKRRINRQIQKSVGLGIVGEDKALAEGKGGARSKARIDKYATGYGAFDVVEPPYNLDYLAKLYEISPAHKAAVDAKVTNIAGLGYHFIESEILKDRMSELQTDDELAEARRSTMRAKKSLNRWLDSLNDSDTFIEILRKVITDYETVGDGYIEVGRTVSGEIGYIGHIPATTIRRRIQKDGYVQIVAGVTMFFRNFQDLEMSNPIGDDARPNEIIHISKYTPTNSYYGVPDVIAARNAIAGEEFASRFNLDYFEHKAVPRYIVVVKNAKLSAESEKKLVNFLQTGLKGQHHRTIYVPLPADTEGKQVEFKLEPVEASITDASFTKYKEINRDEIMMAHRVPLTQVGMNRGAGIGGSRDSARMFKEQVCRPIQDIVEKRLQPFFKEKTNAFNFRLIELTLTDEETSSRIRERELRWDVITPNEVRDMKGMPPIDGGDDRVGLMSQSSARREGNSPAVTNANNNRETNTRQADNSGGPNQPGSDRTAALPGEGERQSS